MNQQHTAPTLHIRPARGWISDPNGMTHHQGRWHVFFQHNPASAQHADMHWGHVSSPDLVAWTEHHVAFGPEWRGPDEGGCWSGAFYPWADRPAVVYTGVVDGAAESTVCVRYAQDAALERWSRPVVVATQPSGANIRMMRDPHPFVWRGRKFALLGAGMEDGTPSVLLFACDDVEAWRYEGVLLDGRDPVAGSVAKGDMWECPQLLQFGETFVLVLSLQTEGRLEDVVYLVGDVHEDAEAPGVPRFIPRTGDLLDHGPHFYAPQTIQSSGLAPLMLGWVRQEDAAGEDAATAVVGCLTLPRRLTLHGDRLEVTVDPALERLVGAVASVDITDDPERGVAGGWLTGPLPHRCKVTVTGSEGSTVRVDLLADGSCTTIDVPAEKCDIWLDGEVAEIYRPLGVATTIRAAGTSSWSLRGLGAPPSVVARELGSTT